jgi:Mg-chelatase subunit ChlD
MVARNVRWFWVFSVGLAALAVLPARAQGLIIPDERRIPPPRPPLPGPPPRPLQPLLLKSQKVTMAVNNGALKVDVEQVFYNPNSVPAEGTYLFPLPQGAVVSNFRLLIDKEPVEGKILSVEEARRIYESYVRRNVDPAILEYVGRNAFQARVFPVPAGGERRIYLGYSQAAEFQSGLYKLVYPLNSERVTGGTAGDLAVDLTIKSTQAIKSVYSPSHEIHVRRDSDHAARATFEGRDVRANRDLVVYYSTSEKAFGLNALTHRRVGEDGYAMLMLAPKREAERGEVQPKDIVLVFDTSGSMQGAKIEQARKAATTILGALNDQDRFNVIRFSSDTNAFRPGVVPANRENREAARAFVEEFRAVGGTAIDDALQAGLASLPKPEERAGRAPFLIFMTDGLPTVGVTDIDRILGNAGRAAPKDLRLFAFGVGADVNTLLLDRLGRDNRGTAEYVSQDEDLETKIGSFYAKIADPVLSGVQLKVAGATLKDVYPARIPDLFAGTQLLVLARYQGHGRAKLTLTGEVNGRARQFDYDLNLPERELGQEFIPKLWAGRRIGFLLEEIRLHGENKELKDEVIRLSKEHGIVTPYTSYLVEEPGLLPGAPAVRADSLHLGSGAGAGGFGGGRGAGPAGPAGPGGPAGKPAAPQGERLLYTQKALQEREVQQQMARRQADGYYRSTGQNAVEASKRVQDLKDKQRGDTEVEVTRSIQGRSFRVTQGAWVDETAKGKLTTVAVRYGSEAYFKLIAADPEWARFLSLGKQVTFRSGKSTMVVVGDKGKETLTDSEIKALAK